MPFIIYNGKYFLEETPIIEANNRGLKFGDGIFETLKIEEGCLNFVEEHFARMWQGLNILQFTIPENFNSEKLTSEIKALTQKNNCQQNARIRITIFRGNGGLFDFENNEPNYIIQAWAWQKIITNKDGLKLGIYKSVKKSIDILSNVKTNNFLLYTMASIFAKKNNCDDAIITNQFNRVCETTKANVFLIKDNIIYTPSITEGCIAGIIRSFLINKLKENLFNCFEKEITLEELLNADEVFLTNSMFDLEWVSYIDDFHFTNNLFLQIRNLFFKQ